MINTPYKTLDRPNVTMHPAMQFLIFTGIFIGILIVGNLIGAGLIVAIYGSKTFGAISAMNINAAHFVPALWILQIFGTTIPIFAAPVIFSYLIVNDPSDYIKPGLRVHWLLFVLVLVIMLLSPPIIEFLSNLNEKMVLPPWLKWMRESEDSAQKVMGVMLNMKTIWDMLLNVLLIGLLTAVVEEFMFRGVIQTIFVRWTKSAHAAVWITAILFSAFHMEFFGFLPRVLLGVIFGYFVVWSGSIWTGVWAHFINNGTDVVLTYLSQRKMINIDEKQVFNGWGYLASFLIITVLMLAYRKIAGKQVLNTELLVPDANFHPPQPPEHDTL